MTIKPLFQYAALAVIAAGIVIIALVAVQLVGQLLALAADYAGCISRLTP
jgi:hypothetical protein